MQNTLLSCLIMAYGQDCFPGSDIHRLLQRNIYAKIVIGNLCAYKLADPTTNLNIAYTAILTTIIIYIHHIMFVVAECCMIDTPGDAIIL